MILIDPIAHETLSVIGDRLRRRISRLRWASEFGLSQIPAILDPGSSWPGRILIPGATPKQIARRMRMRKPLRAAQLEVAELVRLAQSQRARGSRTPGLLVTTGVPEGMLIDMARGDVERASDLRDQGVQALRRRNAALGRGSISLDFSAIPFASAKQAAQKLKKLIRQAP